VRELLEDRTPGINPPSLDTIPLTRPAAHNGTQQTTAAMAEITITGWTTRDVRFPTSLDKTGSDAMNAAGDYSSAYCILETDSSYTGHGMVRTPVCQAPSAAQH
jgi:hypothetical protein